MSSPSAMALSRLAQRLRIERPLAFLDLETTGIAFDTDRVVEVAIALVRPVGGSFTVEEIDWLINPAMPIPPDATAIHGITDEQVSQSPLFEDVAGRLVQTLSGCDFAGFNVSFDLKMLVAEFRRVGVPFDPSGGRILDAYAIFRQKEARDLSAAVRFYCGREHEGAHRAGVDVAATAEVLLAQLERYPDLGAMSVDSLAQFCKPAKAAGGLTEDGRIVWRDGAARLNFGKHKDRTLQELVQSSPGYLKWIADNKDFAPDVRQIVALALRGKFPAAPDLAA